MTVNEAMTGRVSGTAKRHKAMPVAVEPGGVLDLGAPPRNPGG